MYIVSDNSIEKQEEKGRVVFLSTFTGMEWYSNEDKYGKWDISGNTHNTVLTVIKTDEPIDMYAEIKARNISSIKYPTTFMEVKKYNSLMEMANSTSNGKAFYFVSFTDNVTYLFDLSKIDVEKYKDRRLMNEVTLEGQSDKVWKDIYDLPLSMKGVTKYTK